MKQQSNNNKSSLEKNTPAEIVDFVFQLINSISKQQIQNMSIDMTKMWNDLDSTLLDKASQLLFNKISYSPNHTTLNALNYVELMNQTCSDLTSK